MRRNRQRVVMPDHYVQGMNVLCAPFLFVMPELDAFYSFARLMTVHAPRYGQHNLDGVHAGCKLANEVLQHVDGDLWTCLRRMSLLAEMTSFAAILSMNASREPLGEVLKLWDAMFAYGVHLNVVFCVAHLVLCRSEILAVAGSAMKAMKVIEERGRRINAREIVRAALQLVSYIPEELFKRLTLHPFQVDDDYKEPDDEHDAGGAGGDAGGAKSEASAASEQKGDGGDNDTSNGTAGAGVLAAAAAAAGET